MFSKKKQSPTFNKLPSFSKGKTWWANRFPILPAHLNWSSMSCPSFFFPHHPHKPNFCPRFPRKSPNQRCGGGGACSNTAVKSFSKTHALCVCSLILWKSCAKSRWKLCRKFPISMRIVFDWPHPLVSTLGCSDLKTILFRRNGFSNKRIVSHLGRPGEGFLRRLVPRYTRSQGYFLPSSASSAPLEKDYTVDSRIERRKVMSFPALVRLYYHPASTVSWGSQTCLQEIRDCSSVTLDSRLSSNG